MSVPAATAERAGRRPRARRRQADYRAHLCASMWHSALNQRLFRISRGSDPPFYNAEARPRPLRAQAQCRRGVDLIVPISCPAAATA